VSSRRSSEPVEAYLMEPGEGRPSFDPGVLEYLPSDAPLPEVGDVLLLPRSSTGDTQAQAFGWGGTVSPFRVVEREHLYFRGDAETRDRLNPSPALYLKTLLAAILFGLSLAYIWGYLRMRPQPGYAASLPVIAVLVYLWIRRRRNVKAKSRPTAVR